MRALRRRDDALFLTGILAVFSAAGCSKPGDRPPSTENAVSTSSDHAMADSSAGPVDTTAASTSEARESPPVPAPAAVSKPSPADTPPKPSRTLPKPNIDPGRIPAKTPAPGKTSRPGTDSASKAPAAPPAGQTQWVKFDPASNTVTFELVAGPFTFNGFSSGGGTLTVPAKANLVVNFTNKDGTPHSAEVISGEGPIPNAATDPAIPRAYTNKALEGLPQEGSDVMRFPVPESGKYRIFCGVPGHGLSGMWIWLVVDPAAKAPSFGPTKA